MLPANSAVAEHLLLQGRSSAYVEVLGLIDREIAKSKDHGDFTTAELYELIRAKVKAQGER